MDLNSLIGTEILWVRSSTKQSLCAISDVEMGRRVSEIKISDSNNNSPVLEFLVSRVDHNHPEKKWLDECVIVFRKENRPITQALLSSKKASIWSCLNAGVDAFDIDDFSFVTLKSEINRLNDCGD